ncbi:nuclear transport factor 2 family protein [[Eubacterium] hominis]|uniref:nuclear transport factor 2 family protein n=1 Tax=[Eubacterium] hominis TaxID=2764325 RepID=UPI003A4E16EE
MNQEDRYDIYQLNQQLYQAIRTNDWKEKNHLFTEAADIYMSIAHGHHNPNDLAKLFLLSCPHPIHVKQNIENIVLHIQNEEAIQNCHMILFYCHHQEAFHYLQYGMSFVLHYQKTKQGWRISKMVCDLCWVEGNSYWLKGWKLIDYKIPKCHHQLIPTVSNAWSIIEQQTDVQKIQDIAFGYGWVIDTEDYSLLKRIAVSDLCISDGYHGNVIHGINDWIAVLKKLNQKEPCLHHTYRIESIKVDFNQGYIRMFRIEPNRIASNVIGDHNWKMDWRTLDYEIVVTKIQGCWYLEQVSFIPNIRYELPKGYFTYDVS